MSFVGGKLKLKGGDPLKPAAGVKKKKKKASGEEGQLVAVTEGGDGAGTSGGQAMKKTVDGYVLPPRSAAEDRRTEAEKRHEQRAGQREEKELRKLAGKGYRERIKDLNEYLAKQTEHNDIQNVAG